MEIEDERRKKEIEKNLSEWKKSPVSLLFFRSIRRLVISNTDISWSSIARGPVGNSEWMALKEDGKEYLLVRSDEEAFPQDALNEISQERLLGDQSDVAFPPSNVELVLGAKGRLFVVLPTGVETQLPFAVNAPFIQDPARLKIKDPDTSPTNRWLLARVGTLAAKVMCEWLNCSDLSEMERAEAYRFLPRLSQDDNSLESACTSFVVAAFEKEINGKPLLLTTDGVLKHKSEALKYPDELHQVWETDDIVKTFDPDLQRPPISTHIKPENRVKLGLWGALIELDSRSIIEILCRHSPPKPDTWQKLMILWAYLAPDLTRFQLSRERRAVKIVPVRGKGTLFNADQVVRLGEKRLVQSDDDWEFLSRYLLVLNQNWPPYIVEQRRLAHSGDSSISGDTAEHTHNLLISLGLINSSDLSLVIEQVAEKFFGEDVVRTREAVQLTQIAAKLGVGLGEAFRLISFDNELRKGPLLLDSDGLIDELFSKEWTGANLLHPDYTAHFGSCTPQEWSMWVSTGRSKISGFPYLQNTPLNIDGRRQLELELAQRDFSGELHYKYKTDTFSLDDWDFPNWMWDRWQAISLDNPDVWYRIIKRILQQPKNFWEHGRSARVSHIASTGTRSPISNAPITPSWIQKFRQLHCLKDTTGVLHLPGDLMRRTPETESLLDVEPFVEGYLDVEVNRPLLDLLGVRSSPTSSAGILDRLRALSFTDTPPMRELEKWYSRLDHLIDSISTSEQNVLRTALRTEELVYSAEGVWTTSGEVFLDPDEEDVPGAALIHHTFKHFALWRKVGVAERPNADLAIEWLRSLPSGEVLSQTDQRRVEALLPKHAMRIWVECSHWLNLAGQWAPIESLKYATSMQSLVKWKHLHEVVKEKTALFRGLGGELVASAPFTHLLHLAAVIENRLYEASAKGMRAYQPDWLRELGKGLQRIRYEDEAETMRVRELGAKLSNTSWATVSGLQVIPYINNTPAGLPTRVDAAWLDRTLYVEDRPLARLARDVSTELGKAFRREDLIDAVKLCFDRPEAFVKEYMETNFELAPEALLIAPEHIKERAEKDIPTTKPPSKELTEVESGPVNTEVENPTDDEVIPPPDSGSIINDEEAYADDDMYQPDGNAGQLDVAAAEDKDLSAFEPDRVESPRGHKVPLIERFAASQGFSPRGENRYVRDDGSSIVKSDLPGIPWEFRGRDGAILRYYSLKEHCLEKSPLQIDASLWSLLNEFPNLYSLLLIDRAGEPVEVPGTRLQELSSARELKIHPASYRLTLAADEGC
ncbi:MAG TPA: hypothetical protein PKD24_16170 [Pyrinomonadaceae bacterium]|nr:hypothetical protein [Pyrinomonadaceae bacterium]HMP66911.1 hypothetical protein [Pyrinomonadaceae bacterium]